MAAGPVASPDRMPAALIMMVRGSEDCQATSEVMSLTEPSLKVAVAFNWVVLPMDTTGWEGVIVTDCNVGATGLIAAGAACLLMLLAAWLAALAGLALLTRAGASAGAKDELTTALGT